MHTRSLLFVAYACTEIRYVSSVFVCVITLIALVLVTYKWGREICHWNVVLQRFR